jgi:hypothetical protein
MREMVQKLDTWRGKIESLTGKSRETKGTGGRTIPASMVARREVESMSGATGIASMPDHKGRKSSFVDT